MNGAASGDRAAEPKNQRGVKQQVRWGLASEMIRRSRMAARAVFAIYFDIAGNARQ